MKDGFQAFYTDFVGRHRVQQIKHKVDLLTKRQGKVMTFFLFFLFPRNLNYSETIMKMLIGVNEILNSVR